MIRANCIWCNKSNLKTLLVLDNFPIFMGANKSNNKHEYEELNFAVCDDCNLLQLKKLIDLDKLYQNNHNVEVVGKLWENHNDKLCDFIKRKAPHFNILEIGDPTGKLANILGEDNYNEWVIIEPNPLQDFGKVKFKKGWIDDFNLEDFNSDTIIMSHVLEHFYDPIKILKKINSCNASKVIISIPNNNYIIDNYLLPPGGLHFEHSYFVDLEIANAFLNSSGFKIDSVEEFENHSYFIEASKAYDTIDTSNKFKCFKEKFNDVIENYKTIANKILQNYHKTDDVFLFGCHFPAQFLLKLGLENINILGVLDNSNDKIGSKLYGTDLTVFHPSILSSYNNPKVICYMGPYTIEVKMQLHQINNSVEFL